MADKESLIKYWIGQVIEIKMEIQKISMLQNMGVPVTKELENRLNNLLDRMNLLNRLIEEVRKQK